jgi:hypothetical protein
VRRLRYFDVFLFQREIHCVFAQVDIREFLLWLMEQGGEQRWRRGRSRGDGIAFYKPLLKSGLCKYRL